MRADRVFILLTSVERLGQRSEALAAHDAILLPHGDTSTGPGGVDGAAGARLVEAVSERANRESESHGYDQEKSVLVLNQGS